MAEETNYIYCFMIYIIGHLFGLSALFWVGMWIDYDKSGFGFHERADLEFKFHPICMALSLVFLNGEAVMIYRGLRFWPKFVTKAIHAVLHTVCFVFMVLGLKAAWDYHDYHRTNGVITPTPNALYPHSWVGLATASLYGVQFAGGIVAFYIPSTPMHVRAAFMPVHRSAGLLIFAFSLGAALMGTGEKAAFLLKCKPSNTLCTENLYVNFFALSLLGYGACTIPPNWIRKPLPSELPPSQIVQIHPHNNRETLTFKTQVNGDHQDSFKTSL
ncbi:putative cytochrome b561 [Aphelenchoides besseyi]|nr:putative cytochrome b561 [Aphelenchoides besseyi]